MAIKRPDVPIYAKIISILVVGYALSPIDLIPDFIPVLGYIDDLIILPVGVMLAIKLIPNNIMNECKLQATNLSIKDKPKSWFAGGIIIFIWILTIVFILRKIFLL